MANRIKSDKEKIKIFNTRMRDLFVTDMRLNGFSPSEIAICILTHRLNVIRINKENAHIKNEADLVDAYNDLMVLYVDILNIPSRVKSLYENFITEKIKGKITASQGE